MKDQDKIETYHIRNMNETRRYIIYTVKLHSNKRHQVQAKKK